MKHPAETKPKTRLVDLIFIGLGIMLVTFGIFTWLSLNLVSESFLSMLERQGYTIPALVSVRFRQITIIYVMLTWIGAILAFVGAVNEFNPFFEVK